MTKHSRCPVCGSERIEERYQVRGFSLLTCRACTLLFVGEHLTHEDLGAYYEAAEDEFVYTPDNVECLNFYYRLVKERIERFGHRSGRLLDVGCSGGFFLDVMEGWERHGTEIGESVGRAAREKYGDDIFIGPFDDFPEREAHYDVITLQDVLDHFIDPKAAIQKCHRMLRPGGLVVVKVHDISCLYARVTGSRFYAIGPPYHLFYFNPQSLDLLLTQAQFDVKAIEHLPHLLQVRTIFYRLSRGNQHGPFYWAYRHLDNRVGSLRIRKNLHDLITAFALKPNRSSTFAAG